MYLYIYDKNERKEEKRIVVLPVYCLLSVFFLISLYVYILLCLYVYIY